MQGRLGAAVVVGVLIADGVAVAYLHGHTRPEPQPAPPPAITATAPPATRFTVSGTVTAVHAEDAVGAPISPPFTITIPVRGQGELNIEHVTFDGTPGATVAWDGGQALPIAGDGQLVVGAATVDLNTTGATWHLDGTPRLLTAGRYTAGSSVAVGVAGLAEPLDRAPFTVAPGTQGVLVSVGDAQVHLAPAALHLTGPGLLQMLGALRVATPAGTRTVHDLHVGAGPFDLTLRPVTGGYSVSGAFEGPITLLR